jgi:hypothetical protein
METVAVMKREDLVTTTRKRRLDLVTGATGLDGRPE